MLYADIIIIIIMYMHNWVIDEVMKTASLGVLGHAWSDGLAYRWPFTLYIQCIYDTCMITIWHWVINCPLSYLLSINLEKRIIAS